MKGVAFNLLDMDRKMNQRFFAAHWLQRMLFSLSWVCAIVVSVSGVARAECNDGVFNATSSATPPEMRWVFLPASYEEGCISETDCANGVVCFGLEYTPAISGTLISYTTGFFLDCVNGGNPVLSNASCVMDDNSEVHDGCAFSEEILINCSGNTGNLQVEALEPVILHQVCFQLDNGSTTTISEDFVSDLTTTILLPGGGTDDEMPSYSEYFVEPDSVCYQPPGNILGFVTTTGGAGLVSVNLRLYQDFNEDGIADNDSLIRNVFTNSSGFYSMASITPGSYVIMQTQPSGWISNNDEDESEDYDNVTNESPLDNLIPVTISPGEIDSMNIFVEAPLLGTVTGFVFVDFDNDLVPDSPEGLGNVVVGLYVDANQNGQPDLGTPFASDTTTGTGQFIIPNIPTGHYVLIETTPSGYLSIRDFDATNDGDAVSNSNLNDDIIPVSITNGELDQQNYFIDAAICGKVVTSKFDSGYGTLRYNLDCAQPGDTITFHPWLAGQTIDINSDMLFINRDVNLISSVTPKITVYSSVNGLFQVPANTYLVLHNLALVGGLPMGDFGTVIDNSGQLFLKDATLLRNPIMPPGILLLHNRAGAQLELTGNNQIQED